MRLFIAIPLPHDVETALGALISEFRKYDGGVKWVQASNIHLTLRFLGETDQSKVSAIESAVDAVASKHDAITMNIDTIGSFPNLKRPRAIWCGMHDEIERLSAIAGNIEAEMVRIGFPSEGKPFKAHLTLGRVRDGADVRRLAEFLSSYRLRPIPLRLDSIVLFKSTLTPTGPIYERLYQCALGDSEMRFG